MGIVTDVDYKIKGNKFKCVKCGSTNLTYHTQEKGNFGDGYVSWTCLKCDDCGADSEDD